jgi:hypothetical protein
MPGSGHRRFLPMVTPQVRYPGDPRLDLPTMPEGRPLFRFSRILRRGQRKRVYALEHRKGRTVNSGKGRRKNDV